MIYYTVEKLIHGENSILDYYANALELWEEILSLPESQDVNVLAEILTQKQFNFERECGGRRIGQEIMVIVGIAHLHTTADGFGDNRNTAKLIKEALSRSACSIEVKYHAKKIAKDYDLEEF